MHSIDPDLSSVLLEIGTEEVPSRFLPKAISDIRESSEKIFQEFRVQHGAIKAYATPRRISLIVSDVSPTQMDNVKEIFGPSAKAAFDEKGNPTKAASGFAASLGLSVSDLKTRQKGKGDYLLAVIEEKGEETKIILPEILRNIVLSLRFPKSMRWGNGSFTFVRPISWILAVSGTEKIDIDIDGIRSSNLTKGHRFLAPASFPIKDISSYLNVLENNYVVVDQNRRKELILKSMNQLFQGQDLSVLLDEELLETVNYLIEYPVPVLCSFEEEYLRLPKELLITVMKDHQKYFGVKDSNSRLVNNFVVISNTKAENAETVRIGAQRVIKARFDDAKFYYSEDTAKPLADRTESLKSVTFHDRLGSLHKKTERIVSLSEFIAQNCYPDLKDTAVRAAWLSKTDLITGVVREFPELQGIMGKYYAEHDGEDVATAEALEEQYMPKSFGDFIPKSDVGAGLSLADKVDSLASFFSIGLVPTGSEDPFALRRQAMAVISILLEKGYDLKLRELFALALHNLEEIKPRKDTMHNIISFMEQRFEFILASKGYPQDSIKSVISKSFDIPLREITSRLEALVTFRNDVGFGDFLLAIKRVNNIIPKTEMPPVNPELLKHDEELNLYNAFIDISGRLDHLIKNQKFYDSMKTALELTLHINSFFDKVLVMDKRDDVKNNRLALLRGIWEAVSGITDFSSIQQ